MPRDIQFERPPAGFAVKAMQPGENGLIEVRGFHTSDEGFDFTHRLEVCDDLIAGLPEISPSQVDHLLAVIQRNGQTTAHVNELTFTSKVHVKRGCKAGEPMMTNDIADITEMNVGVEIPSDCGVIFLFSWRWRKGLFFDLQPLGPKPTPRTYNLDAMFAACYCALMFPEMFSLSEDEWKALLAAGWFPFVGLRTRTRSEMLLYCREGWDLARLHDRIVDECKELVPQFAESCETSPLFRTHAESIKVAARHFTTGDPLSAAHLLYPRIEGVLRTYHLDRGETPTRKTERFFATALQGGPSEGINTASCYWTASTHT